MVGCWCGLGLAEGARLTGPFALSLCFRPFLFHVPWADRPVPASSSLRQALRQETPEGDRQGNLAYSCPSYRQSALLSPKLFSFLFVRSCRLFIFAAKLAGGPTFPAPRRLANRPPATGEATTRAPASEREILSSYFPSRWLARAL